jgi:hypothetical protein
VPETRHACDRANATVLGTAYLKLGLYRKAATLSQLIVPYHDEVRRLTLQ